MTTPTRMRAVLYTLISLLSLAAAPAVAELHELQLAPSQEALVDLSGNPQDTDDTALRIKNLSSKTGIVTVEFDPQAGPGEADSVAPGFALIDGTLVVSSDIPPGEVRARYRVEARAGRMQRAGIRAGQARMMRRDAQTGRWRPAIRAIRAAQADVRYLRDARADFVLGHHGFSQSGEYVWAVLDVNSRYAAGGATAASVPLAAPAALVALGAALLLAAARVRSRA